MKTDKEFIKGIYEKFEEHKQEKTKLKQIRMKKITNIAAIMIVLFSSLVLWVGGSNNENVIIEQKEKIEESKISLKTVGNFENFYNIMKKSTQNGKNSEILDYAVEEKTNDVEKNSSEARTSNTNTQVKNVDEADIAKVEGNYIYYIAENKVVIINAEIPENAEKITEINYKNEIFSPSEIFVTKNKLVVIGNKSELYTETNKISDVSTYDVARINNDKSMIIIYDITNKNEPKETRRVEVDGYYLSSRMIDNNLYFVSNKYLYSNSILRYNIQDLNENQFKPHCKDTAISQEEKCIDFNRIYCFNDIESKNYLMLVGLNIESNEEADIKTFLGAGENIYCSEKNMYIATSKIQYNDKYEYVNSSTHILKFALNNGEILFTNEAEVNGMINNQFSMDETENYFRIATTVGKIWNLDENTSNSLYVLNDKLEEVGKLTGIAKSEKIYSVRYVGDKAYMVTFKEVDPLFVIDLSNPASPQILGELKIPGYSTYLHPYDETHVIGFGYDTKQDGTRTTTNGLKMAMFDISNVNNPQELFKITIGDRYTSSELIYNHKALLYSKEKNIIAFPLTSYEDRKTNSRATVYNIDLEKGFSLKGEISHINDDYRENVERIVFVNNTYYTLSKTLVKAANMETLKIVKEIEI